jgi:hypothetical protein
MSDLEQRLTQLGGELDWPDTPDLAGRVRARLGEAAPAAEASPPADRWRLRPTRPGRRPRRGWLPAPAGLPRALALALVALLVLAGGVVAAVPSVRDSVLEFFGLRGATVERRPELPPVPDRGPLELGERTTLERARARLRFEPLVPRAAGRPDRVYVNSRAAGGEVALTYRPRSGLPEAGSTGLGLLVGEFRGDLHPEYLGKIAGETTTIERLRVDGRRAIWIEGAPHLFFYRPPDTDFGERELRLASNVLLLERGNLLVRLEGAFSRERALELARSLRASG